MTTDGDRIVRLPEVIHLTGVGKSTIRKLERAGKFPTRLKLSPRRIGWKLSDVQAWIANPQAA